jgi:segregation and condensation protein A
LDPIDMLVDLVLRDEMDPWDIDIVSLANRFLEEVRRMVKINLRLSGKTLLTSSLLLRMKSENLMPEENGHNGHNGHEDYGWDDGAYYEDASYNIPSLPVPLRRRAERKVTLFELVEALQRALSEEMIRKNFPPKPRAKPKLIIKVDEETVREKILSLYDRLQELAKDREVIRFNELLSEQTRRHIIEVLLYLLYLDSQGKLIIWQKELFGEVFITLR